jgi:hypothetical protein
MRPNLLATSALILAAMSPFAAAQATASVASRVAAQNALFDDAWQAAEKVPSQAEGVIAANPFILPLKKFPATNAPLLSRLNSDALLRRDSNGARSNVSLRQATRIDTLELTRNLSGSTSG